MNLFSPEPTFKGTLYRSEVVEKIKQRYIERGGDVNVLEEGVLLDGLVICTAPGWKSLVIKERYINAWASGYSVRKYNKLPKKYNL